MAFHNILSKLDRAITSYIIASGAGSAADVYPAKLDADKILPNTIVVSDNFVEDPPRSRSFVVPVAVHVRTPSSVDKDEDPLEIAVASELRVQATFDLFYPEEDQDGSVLAGLITAAARASAWTDLQDFTCVSAVVKGGDRGQREKDWAWVDTLNLECFCCADALE